MESTLSTTPRRSQFERLRLLMLCTWTIVLSLSACGGGEFAGEGSDGNMAASATVPLEGTYAQALSASKARLPVAASAPGFYVDSVNGNDANDGSAGRPWRTLARASAVRLSSGQGLYLRCGQVWRESLHLSGRQLAPGSAIAGYGPECATSKARLSGTDDLSGGWSRSGVVWSKSLPSGTAKITQLFIDGQRLRKAQWPNPAADTRRPALLLAADAGVADRNRSLKLASVDALTLEGKDLAGASIQIRTQPWMIESHQIASTNAQHLLLKTATRWDLRSGQGFVLLDKHWMLDEPSEFFHDTSAQKLYLIAPRDVSHLDVNTARVEGSVRDEVLVVSESLDLRMSDIEVHGARETGLRLTNSPGARLQRVDAHANAVAGVRLQQWTPLANHAQATTVEDGNFVDNGQHGIDATHVRGAIIARNQIRNTGVGVHHQINVIAAISGGPSGQIEYNNIDGAGYAGIMYSSLGGSKVVGNRIARYCTRLTDCGAIYTWTGRDGMHADQASQVIGNAILGGQSDLNGMAPGSSDFVAGIYIDDFSNGALIEDNLLAETPVGIFLHNTSNTTVRGNRIWLPTRVALWASMDQQDADWMKNNSFEDNEVAPVVQAHLGKSKLPELQTAQAIWFWHGLSGTEALGPGRNDFRRNRLVELHGPVSDFAWLRGNGEDRRLSTAEWLVRHAGDWEVQRPASFVPILAETGPELVSNSGFEDGLTHWRTWHDPSSNLFIAHPEFNPTSCVTNCVKFRAGHRGDLLASSVLALKAGTPYVYRWTASMPLDRLGTVGAPYISRDGSPWDGLQDTQGFIGYTPRTGAPGESLVFETFFVSKESASGRVNLQLDTLGVPFIFHAVSVKEVTGYKTAGLESWARVVSVPAGSANIIDCQALGWPTECVVVDQSGSPVKLPLELEPGTTLLLLRVDSPFKR